MSTPETIYLIPGKYDGDRGMIWSDDPDPDSYSDPDEAVKYVRADTLPQPVLPPYPPEGEGMPRYGLHWDGPTKPLSVPMDCGYWTPWHLASTENKRLQARVAEIEVELSRIIDDEDDAMNQVLFLVRSIQESPECIGIVKRKAGVESISVNLRDYLEDLGVLPVSRDRLFLSCGAEKTGGSENAK